MGSSLPVFLFLWLCLGGLLGAAPVRLQNAQPSAQAGPIEDLPEVSDGIDAGQHGWMLPRDFAQPEAICFEPDAPVRGRRLRVALCFLSGFSNAHFNHFSVSVTSDSEVSLHSQWKLLTPKWFYSTSTKLELREDKHLHSSGSALNAVFVLEGIAPVEVVTGFRLEILPDSVTEENAHLLAHKGRGGENFVLTEFRVESFEDETTNVALGAPVRASHAIWGSFRPENLTDGLPATFAHPKDPSLGEEFFYEIDFGRVRQFDHFALRNRGDGVVPDRMSCLQLQLYSGDSGGSSGGLGGELRIANWKGTTRMDRSYPDSGGVDIVRAQAGTGKFEGRYLRISSSSPVALSPQLAEVEAYEPLVPILASVRADQKVLSAPLTIPAGTRWLAFNVRLPAPQESLGVPLRWRLRGFHGDWQPIKRDGMAEGACPPAGEYELEVQAAHTDGQWNSNRLRIPLRIEAPIWQSPYFHLGLAGLLGGAGLVLVRNLARRRLARRIADLERRQALDEERARIARDMHDVVGARLTQLTVLHDLFAAQFPQAEAASASLRRLTGTARESVAALDEVVWAINPRNDTLANVVDYLCHCASEYLSPLGVACRQDIPPDWPTRSVGAQPRHQLLLAFKEALQNIAKHAAATEVTLRLRLEGEELVVILEDNGRGLPDDCQGPEKDGLGNMRARLSAVGGSCRIVARPEGGTLVEMRLPI